MTLAGFLADPLRVTQDSDIVLEIENRPIRRAAIAVVMMLVAIASGLAAITDGATGTGIILLAMVGLIGWLYLHEAVQLTQLRLDRDAGFARLRVTTLRGRHEETCALSDLHRLESVAHYGTAAGNDETRLVLVCGSGPERREIVVPMFRPDPDEVAHLTGLINGWLSRREQRAPS
ncbi:hypothetical protein SAMN05444398_12143 [Roseovarius pacificus]|uniref:Uncharacterized protein n=1 Tax=Roseovarius pacificus TaxID=337701 RepID=A0A1M7JQP2_9RHOB|nr:hypothetical protein [Roseovarius pacificus]GGO58486.1 hypothetical protein GCM10011315_28170 [Roseovarius pacificus]SHM54887.1 hypothetical protein SAMN05444398_12143 [Roseovarius pacificus]